MLKGNLLHPGILEALARAGHGSKVLIADGNYPAGTKLGANARLVHLNLAPGLVSGTQVLDALVGVIPIEAAEVMQFAKSGPYALEQEPGIWADFRSILSYAGHDLTVTSIERHEFYEAASRDDVALIIATGEQRIYANLLLTIGVVMSP